MLRIFDGGLDRGFEVVLAGGNEAGRLEFYRREANVGQPDMTSSLPPLSEIPVAPGDRSEVPGSESGFLRERYWIKWTEWAYGHRAVNVVTADSREQASAVARALGWTRRRRWQWWRWDDFP